MLSFSELEFNTVFMLLSTTCYPYLIFLLLNLKPMIYLYHGSEKCEKLAMLPQIWLTHIAMHSILQMKLYRAAVIQHDARNYVIA